MTWTRAKYAEHILDKAVQSMAEDGGARHDALARAAGKVANYVEDGSLDRASVEGALSQAAHALGLDNRTKEVKRTIRDILGRGKALEAWYPSGTGDTPVRVDTPQRLQVTIPPPTEASVRITHYAKRMKRKGSADIYFWGDLAKAVASPCPMPPGGKDELALWGAHELEGDNNYKDRVELRMHALFLDYDDEPALSRQTVADWWGTYRHVAHATASSGVAKGGKAAIPRGRVIVALSRPVDPEEFSVLAGWAMDGTRGAVGHESKEFSRMYYVPAVGEGAYWYVVHLDAPAIDVDEVLAEARAATVELGDQSIARRTIRRTSEIHRAISEAIDSLSLHPALYHRGGSAVRISDGVPRVLEAESMRFVLSEVARFVSLKEGKDGIEEKPISPPADIARAVLQLGQWGGLRSLERVSRSPIVAPGGQIVAGDGYHAKTRTYLHGADSVELIDDPVQALREVVCDFEMDDVGFSGWLALLLTPLARSLYRGPSPLFVVAANVRGAGKTMLSEVAAMIAAQDEYELVPCPERGDELEKTLRVLIAGDEEVGARTVAILDNATKEIGGATIDAITTSAGFSCRVLGKSRMVRLEQTATTLVFTSNNATFKGDTARRVVPITLASTHSRPEDRTGFRYPDLRGHVRRHRTRYLGAALSILAAYERSSGVGALKAFGSFEGWSRVVRGAVVHAGLPDPLETRRKVNSHGDSSGHAFEALLEMVSALYGRGEFSVSSLSSQARRHSDTPIGSGWTSDDVRDVLAMLGVWDGKQVVRRSLGRCLARWEGRLGTRGDAQGCCFKRTRTKNGSWQWQVMEGA